MHDTHDHRKVIVDVSMPEPCYDSVGDLVFEQVDAATIVCRTLRRARSGIQFWTFLPVLGSATFTVAANWALEWDQAGLCNFAGLPPGRNAGPLPQPFVTRLGEQAGGVQVEHLSPYPTPAPASEWVKAGLEFSNNTCRATSICATNEGADWSLASLPSYHAHRLDLRIKLERIGYALWISYEDGPLGWSKIREVTWFFWGVEDKAVRVGVYAGRPASLGLMAYEQQHSGSNPDDLALTVEFEGLEIF
ncbi:hypothetical protein BJ546DRAFT_946496 [Cryomyces antarcticus]